MQLPFDVIHIGKLDIHASHEMYTIKGVIYCDRCGAVSRRKKLGKLASICLPPTIYGLNNRDRIRGGCFFLINIPTWPDNIFKESLANLFDSLIAVADGEDERAAAASINNTYLNTFKEIHNSPSISDNEYRDVESGSNRDSCSSGSQSD